MAYIVGPEQHGRRWRVRVDHGRKKCPCCGKRRHDVYFDTQAQAEQNAQIMRAELAGPRTVEWAITVYLEWLTGRKRSGAHLDKTERRLREMMAGHELKPIVWLEESQAERLYRELVERSTSDTSQLNILSQVRTWWRWLMRKRHVSWNPWAIVDPVGKRRSKAKRDALTAEDGWKLHDWCMATDSQDSMIAAMALCLALRAAEICQVRIDGEAVVVPIDAQVKNEAAVRRLWAPEWLLDLLGRHALPKDGQAVYRACKRACRAAGVREIGPHAIRATSATMTAATGSPVEIWYRSMGHSHPGVTRGHYIADGAEAGGKARRLDELGAQRRNRDPNPPGDGEKTE